LLKSALAERDLEVIETDVSEFLKAGGACKCLTLEIGLKNKVVGRVSGFIA
jgi:N-dimethylarginine dimethylaminohydrolase